MFKPAISIYYQSEIAQTKMQHHHSLSLTGFLWEKIYNHVKKRHTRRFSVLDIFLDRLCFLFAFIPVHPNNSGCITRNFWSSNFLNFFLIA